MKCGVVTFPGSNCNHDMMYALGNILGQEVVELWHKDTDTQNCELIVLPGGFSYGDYLRCGSMASKSKIMKSVIDFANSGGMVMGICNGFQILVETGLVPGVLLRNKYLEFICKNVFVKINNKKNTYFKNIDNEVLELHIAHNEGNYFCTKDQLKEIEDNNQIAIYYCDQKGQTFDQFILRHSKDREIIVLTGDFQYHACLGKHVEFQYIDHPHHLEGTIRGPGLHALLISAPFSDFGCIHPDFEHIMRICVAHNIPVCLDLAYWGIAKHVHINLDAFPCIKEVTCSLSKPFFTLENHRVGIRFTKDYVDDGEETIVVESGFSYDAPHKAVEETVPNAIKNHEYYAQGIIDYIEEHGGVANAEWKKKNLIPEEYEYEDRVKVRDLVNATEGITYWKRNRMWWFYYKEEEGLEASHERVYGTAP